MMLKLNNGEGVTIQANNNPKKSIVIICKGDWIGMREFEDSPADKGGQE